MAKKKSKKLKGKDISITLFSFGPLIPQIHPNEEQEDPINGKYVKSIEIDDHTYGGPDWK